MNNKKNKGKEGKQKSARKNTVAQTYKYEKKQSIVFGLTDDFWFTSEEYLLLYSFYVTYSICGQQSAKKRTIQDYGWDSNGTSNAYIKSGLRAELQKVVDLIGNSNFLCTDEDNLEECFQKQDLEDGIPNDILTERYVIGKTQETNPYFKLFYRIRDGLAHGGFALKYASNGERMFIMQDQSTYNVSARIILKVSTLVDLAKTVNKNKLISIAPKGNSGKKTVKCYSAV